MNKEKTNIVLKSQQLNLSKLTKVYNLFFECIHLEIKLVNDIRQIYNPNKYYNKILKAYEKKNIFDIIKQLFLYLSYSSIYYFFPIWIFILPIHFFTNLEIWKLVFLKLNVSIAEYRSWSKNSIISIWKQTTTFKVRLIVFPFFLGFFKIIFTKYQNQTFSYFIKKNVPGFSFSSQKQSWETFEHITSKKIKLNTLFFTDSSFYKQKLPDNISKILLFIKRIDFYSDFLIIQLNSKWQKQQNQLYLGTFRKQNNFNDIISRSQKDKISNKPLNNAFKKQIIKRKHLKLTNQNKFNFDQTKKKISSTFFGNNWYQISPRDFSRFFTINKKTKISFIYKLNQPSNWLQKNNGNFKELLLQQEFFSYFYLNLDELPFKLNRSFEIQEDIENKGLNKKKLPIKNYYSQKSSSHFSKPSRNGIQIQKQKFIVLKNNQILKSAIDSNKLQNKLLFVFKNVIPLEKQIDKPEFSSLTSKNLPNYYQSRQKFYKKYDFLQNALKKIFYSEGLKPLTSLDWYYNFSELNLEKLKTFSFSETELEKLLKKLNNQNFPQKNYFIQPRLMSGYTYPDMSNHETRLFVLDFFYKKAFSDLLYFSVSPFRKKQSQFLSSEIQINLPPSFIPYSQYSLPRKKSPVFELKYRPTFFEGISHSLYEGPGVLRNEKTNELLLKNKSQVLNWLKSRISTDNPLTAINENYFGENPNNDDISQNLNSVFSFWSKNASKIEKLLKVAEESSLPKDLSFPSEKNIQNESGLENFEDSEDFPLIPWDDQFVVPYLKEKDWLIILEKIKTEVAKLIEIAKLENQENDFDENQIQILVPILSIKQPNNQLIEWPLTEIDYQPNKYFHQILFLNKIINLHYLPHSQTFLNQNLTRKKIIGARFRKVLSIYKPKLYKLVPLIPFSESWEPITTNSWLIITQLGFGLFTLQILQDFYKKYGKELIAYLLDLAASAGLNVKEAIEDLQAEENDKDFRLIKNVQKRFQDIVGIDSILPELGEIVWFLRNYGRSFKVGNIIPKGILLVGPPGTGKTLLVQAIAGEAEVPVLVQSGSSLNDPEQEETGAQKLQTIFEKARQMSPCIVFIDEIDALGETRDNVLKNPMGTDELIESTTKFSENNIFQVGTFDLIPKPKTEPIVDRNDFENSSNDHDIDMYGTPIQNSTLSNQSINQILQENVDKQEAKHQQLSLLMQFLIELDGLKSRKGVIVIGATNRPNVLDPALIRPGRFDQILHIELPSKQKRIEILKLYSKNLGTETNISWDYLANRTIGFSAADLSAAMNKSAIKAILKETLHTVQSIEQGIESITGYSTEKLKFKHKKNQDPFFISRLAYYQAGKAILHTLLSQHPPAVVLHLWPKAQNEKHTFMSNVLQKDFSGISRRSEIESRIIGLYAGKAAELLNLCQLNKNKKTSLWQSDLGIEELTFASSLTYSMIDKWYFYSKKIVTRKFNNIVDNRNAEEFPELEVFELFNIIGDKIETEVENETKSFIYGEQKGLLRPWWQTQIVKQIGLPAVDDWYRIYLPDPEESHRNEEWLAPEDYFHNNESLSNLLVKNANSSINWNDLYDLDRDYLYHGVVLACFNKAFSILDQNRELLDYYAYYLMRNQIIRQHEITQIMSKFHDLSVKNKKLNITKESKQTKIKIVDKFWGEKTRRNFSRFINFETLKK